MAKSVDEIIQDIEKILTQSKALCTEALRPVVAAAPKPDQAYACLELFHMQRYELVYNAFYVRNNKLETEYACFPNFMGEKSFIPALDKYFEDLFSNREFTDSEAEIYEEKHQRQFLDWFKSCWKDAGGENAKTPTYFCFEKEYKVQDIFSEDVMEEEECARHLGFTVTAG